MYPNLSYSAIGFMKLLQDKNGSCFQAIYLKDFYQLTYKQLA